MTPPPPPYPSHHLSMLTSERWAQHWGSVGSGRFQTKPGRRSLQLQTRNSSHGSLPPPPPPSSSPSRPPSEVNTHLRGLADSSSGSAAAGTCRPPAAEGWWASGGSSARGRRSRSLGPGAWSSAGATWDHRPADGQTCPWQQRLGRLPLGLQPLERERQIWVFSSLRRKSSAWVRDTGSVL